MTSEEDERVRDMGDVFGQIIFDAIHEKYCEMAKDDQAIAHLSAIHGMIHATAFALGNLLNTAHQQRLPVEGVVEIAEFARNRISTAVAEVYAKYAPGQDGFKGL